MTENTDIDHRFDRVTSVLYPFSGLSKVDPTILRNAADRGTQVHIHCDCIVKDIPMDDVHEDHQGYVDSFKIWAEGKNFLENPKRFYCDDLLITGECDGLYEKDGETILFDIKTPLRESSTWPLQGSAYAYLAAKYGYKISKVEFIKVDKHGKEPVVYEYRIDVDEFMNILNIYRKYFKNVKTDYTDY